MGTKPWSLVLRTMDTTKAWNDLERHDQQPDEGGHGWHTATRLVIRGQYEGEQNGTLHFQGLLKTTQVRFSAVKRQFPRHVLSWREIRQR